MKKRLSFTIATVVAAMAATISTASASQTEAATDTNLQPAWEEQLQNGMEIGQETDRRLKLVGYEYLGRIGSAQEAQELVDEIFADESYTVYTDIYYDGHRDYDFQTWGSLRKDYEYCGMAVRDQIRHVIATQPTDVIRLTWSHNGNTYTTKALASPDEGIIYDNVATYAVQDVYIVDEESTNGGERGFKKEVRSVNVIDLPVNLGLTGAFQTGMKYAWRHGYDSVIQFDADGQHRPDHLADLVRCQQETSADIVVGSRFVTEPKPRSLRMAGSNLISALIKLTCGVTLRDPTSGMRLWSRPMIEQFATRTDLSPEPDTLALLIRRKGAHVAECQVSMRERTAGESYLTLSKSVTYMANACVSILFAMWFRK